MDGTVAYEAFCYCQPPDLKDGDVCNKCGVRWVPAKTTVYRPVSGPTERRG